MPIQPGKKTKAPRQQLDYKWCVIHASEMILASHFILRNEARFDRGVDRITAAVAIILFRLARDQGAA
jgi:hypothetical protein